MLLCMVLIPQDINYSTPKFLLIMASTPVAKFCALSYFKEQGENEYEKEGCLNRQVW